MAIRQRPSRRLNVKTTVAGGASAKQQVPPNENTAQKRKRKRPPKQETQNREKAPKQETLPGGPSPQAGGPSPQALPEPPPKPRKKSRQAASVRRLKGWKRVAKMFVICDICGREVRKDVISRHKATQVCKQQEVHPRRREVHPRRAGGPSPQAGKTRQSQG